MALQDGENNLLLLKKKKKKELHLASIYLILGNYFDPVSRTKMSIYCGCGIAKFNTALTTIFKSNVNLFKK